jgi:dephospho-CoA kinase
VTAAARYRTLAVGITGGIGSGKTEACHAFESLDVRVLYADLVARDLIDSHPEIKKKLQRALGTHIYGADGRLDRKEVAKLVFHDPLLHARMNDIVHPFVLAETEREIRAAKERASSPIIMTEAALIFESGADRMLDYVIVIDAEEELRIERVMKRDRISRAEVLERVRAQMPAREKVDRADFVIVNNADAASLKERCRFLYRLLRAVAEGPGA